jgi:hypothetical protein
MMVGWYDIDVPIVPGVWFLDFYELLMLELLIGGLRSRIVSAMFS